MLHAIQGQTYFTDKHRWERPAPTTNQDIIAKLAEVLDRRIEMFNALKGTLRGMGADMPEQFWADDVADHEPTIIFRMLVRRKWAARFIRQRCLELDAQGMVIADQVEFLKEERKRELVEARETAATDKTAYEVAKAMRPRDGSEENEDDILDDASNSQSHLEDQRFRAEGVELLVNILAGMPS